MEAARVWRSTDGRIRLGFRLLMFLALFTVVAVLAEPLSPRAFPWAAVPTLVGALLAGWALLSLEGRPIASLGFRLDRGAVSGTVAGLALGIVLGLLAVALMTAAGAVRWQSDAGSVGDWASASMVSLWMLALPAAAEEAMLRGYPLQALAEVWGAAWALVVTSVVFALLHLPNPGVGWVGTPEHHGCGPVPGSALLAHWKPLVGQRSAPWVELVTRFSCRPFGERLGPRGRAARRAGSLGPGLVERWRFRAQRQRPGYGRLVHGGHLGLARRA